MAVEVPGQNRKRRDEPQKVRRRNVVRGARDVGRSTEDDHADDHEDQSAEGSG